MQIHYLLEGSDFLVIIWLDVIDSHTAIGLLKKLIALLWDTNEGSITSMEEHSSSPIVGEVLAECTSGTCRLSCRVTGRIHGGFE